MMIKKAQFRFVATTMAILLGFFAIIFSLVSLFLRSMTLNAINNSLQDIEQVYLNSNCESTKNDSIVACFYFTESGGISVIEPIVYDEDSFTITKAMALINEGAKRSHNEGFIENYYYKYTLVEDKATILIGDMSVFLEGMKQATNKTLIGLIILFVVLTIICWGASFKVFQPIKEGFYRQQTFISNASHELKTPLAIITANADVLETQNSSTWTNNIKEQATRMSELLDDMLSLAKINEGKSGLNTEEFNLSDEIIACTLPYDSVAFEKGKNLVVDVTENIIGKYDRESVRKVVAILLDNAIKYGKKGEDIIITLSLKKKPILTVFNMGNNVPDNDKDKIFERFYRAEDSRSRELGGSGLGLAIAKSICTVNKWKIFASPILNESMTITVIF